MNIYLTSGTADFMEMLLKKYKKETMFILYDAQQTVLLHESEKKSKFAAPRSYEITDAVGEFSQEGIYAITYVSTLETSRAVLEERFRRRSEVVQNEPGFIAYRFLRPLKNESYAIISQWTGIDSYEVWKKSSAYADTLSDLEKVEEITRRDDLTNPAPYTKIYFSTPVEVHEEEEGKFF